MLNGIESSVLYTSYNSITLIPILITLKNLAKKKKEQISISVLSMVCILILGFAIIHIISGIENISKVEIPLSHVAKQSGSIISLMYGVAIILAMLTSAVSAGLGFIQNISKNEEIKKGALIILNIIAVVLSGFGFSNLLGILYPIFGVLGLVQMFFVFMT